MKTGKTIDLTPTWVWVVSFCLRLIEDGDQPKAEAGFVAEVERLGPDVALLLREFREGDSGTRARCKKLLMDKARRCDEALQKKEKRS